MVDLTIYLNLFAVPDTETWKIGSASSCCRTAFKLVISSQRAEE